MLLIQQKVSDGYLVLNEDNRLLLGARFVCCKLQCRAGEFHRSPEIDYVVLISSIIF